VRGWAWCGEEHGNGRETLLLVWNLERERVFNAERVFEYRGLPYLLLS